MDSSFFLGDQRQNSSRIIIRTTSVDELPKLWNILKGDMAIESFGCIIEATERNLVFQPLFRSKSALFV